MFRLLLLCFVMLVGTLTAAFVPLFMSLSPKRVTAISTYGTGLLVGAALSIVIPEGVAAVYGSVGEGHGHEEGGEHGHEHEHGMEGWVGMALLSGFVLMYVIHTLQPHEHAAAPQRSSYAQHRQRASIHFHRTSSATSELEPLSSSPSISLATELPPRVPSPSPREFDWDSSASEDYDTAGGRRPGPPTPRIAERARRYEGSPTARGKDGTSAAYSTVIGLLVHSLADGISLGASSAAANVPSSSASLEFIIFLAIILHKAPTAFALASLLISTPSSTTFIRKSLIAFSLATPVGALLTYALLSLVGVGENANFWTGMVLTFSGGTFLFVASHVIGKNEEEADPTADIGPTKIWLVVAGMVTPSLLSRLVGHGH